jgi:tetratricopeptide (TPR) repeat protein
VWDFLSDEATPFMAAAVRGFGREVLAAEYESATPLSREDVGRQVLRLVFGAQDAGQAFPQALADVIAEPGSEPALAALTCRADEAFESDPAMASAAAVVLAGFYRMRADGGNVRALVDLGDFLHWDDAEGARAAYQEAIDAGHMHAMIGLAKVLANVIGDEAAALSLYRQAISSGDPDLSAEAMFELAHASRRDADAARAMFQQAIQTRHPEWAAAAMVGLAHMLQCLGDPGAAKVLCRQAIQAGNADWSGHASFALGRLLESQGDIAGAKAAWQRVIDSANAAWAGPAFTGLVNLLREHDDINGLRAAYQKAAELGNPDALYALDVLGQELDRRGDADGAHAAWQQAIDAGYEDADDLRERISSPPEPEDEPEHAAALADLPPQFDARKMALTGIEVLDHGLLALPGELTYRMAIPVAYWKADRCAVVLFLRFSRHRRDTDPMATMATFSRDGEHWNPHRHWHGTGWSHDPIANPGDLRDLGGRPLVTGGGSSSTGTPAPGWPAAVIHGRVSPAVKELALIQDGHEDRRPLESHFGAWVICTESPGPFRVTALDENGTVLAEIQV